MSMLVAIITSADPEKRNLQIDTYCKQLSVKELLQECEELEVFRKSTTNLYEQVRALFFLYAIHRFYLPDKKEFQIGGLIPFEGYEDFLHRRFEEALQKFLFVQKHNGPCDGISSALAATYRSLAFQTLANQVRFSVRSVRGNQWMFRAAHSLDHPLKIVPALLRKYENRYPILHEQTPVRMDLSHSGWSDIFFLGMDFPEGAKVLNISINLSVRDGSFSNVPKPPVEVFLRVIEKPVIRLVSTDLQAVTEITSLRQMFDFAADYLGLLKAAVIASGIIPPSMEGSHQTIGELLQKLVGEGMGLEIVSQVNGIPKGSRLAVSTTLLASIITACMRATGQIRSLETSLTEEERRIVAARSILGEWLGGSGGGWQDSGGIWPGIKIIEGVNSKLGDCEFGISRGCLLPHHTVLTDNDVSQQTRQKLQESLILVHGGMAQDVGPILEMVTERYLLRSDVEWMARLDALSLFHDILNELKKGNIKTLGQLTHKNFFGPIQTIIPWATNLYTESIIACIQQKFGKDFWGFWMLGGMSGGGMGFMFDPEKKEEAQIQMEQILREQKKRFERGIPFAMEPVVYDFTINEKGTWAELLLGQQALLPKEYYTLTVPSLLRHDPLSLTAEQRNELEFFTTVCRKNPAYNGVFQQLLEHLLPVNEYKSENKDTLQDLLQRYGFDRIQHEQIKSDLINGRIGLAQNRLPRNVSINDVTVDEIIRSDEGNISHYQKIGEEAIAGGTVAVLTLAAGAGTRWTKGAGTVKALNPFCKLGGRHRTFLEIHIAKIRKINKRYSTQIPYVISTSYLTHQAIEEYIKRENNFHYGENLLLSHGSIVGLRLVPTVRDLRFAWEEMPQQLLDEQAQKVLDSMRAALIEWARNTGEGSDYTDNIPMQCLNPVGHWYELPNMFSNGVLLRLMETYPNLRYLLVHNIDTVGVTVDPVILGRHIESQSAMSIEVIPRRIDDRGGGLANIDGRIRLVEGLALPREEDEFRLSFYNSATYWIDIEKMLKIFRLTKESLKNQETVQTAVRNVAQRMPTYITLKNVKKRWGKGQEDVYPTLQYEKIWGDMTTLPELKCTYIVVPRLRGQQLKEPAQMDGWLRDGSAVYVDQLCEWY